MSSKDKDTITLRERAKEKVKEIIGNEGGADEKCLRVFVSGGGCSGFEDVKRFYY